MYEIVSFGMFLIAILTIMFKDLIVLLLGAEYRTATFIMPFLVFMPVMYTISETTVIGINFYKKTRWHLFITIIVFFVNLGMTFVLVPKMGATGAAIATGLSFIIFMFLRTLISKKYFNVDYKLYKFFFITILVALYALYNSFYSWSWLNVLLGALMIGSLSIFYRKTIKLVIKEKDKLFKKGEERG
ncbi:polysaccharide biosynthesis C-terminal domain-containing protein [Bacillus aquiflavi]|nr:polysaccharide biosynthesis C-terminal domain-containing protein [Bacillus aquiflavi]UAC47863.1 polysaccharide biosynthesis C-terminal domain-containing protein [Bacillus aquiflavi]